jgi:hypothetical protein
VTWGEIDVLRLTSGDFTISWIVVFILVGKDDCWSGAEVSGFKGESGVTNDDSPVIGGLGLTNDGVVGLGVVGSGGFVAGAGVGAGTGAGII